MKNKLIWLGILVTSQLFAWDDPAIFTEPGKNFFPQIISDGGSGAIVTWLHKNDYGCYEVYGGLVDNDGDTAWTKEISHMEATGTNVGHRLNHHIAPGWYDDNGIQNQGHAIYFWVNHFDTTNYRRGYYLQKTDGSGNLKWPDEGPKNPVQVLTTHYVPASSLEEDGDPISVCPDGEGDCVVVMKIFDVTLINDIIVSAVLKGYNKPQTNPFVGF